MWRNVLFLWRRTRTVSDLWAIRLSPSPTTDLLWSTAYTSHHAVDRGSFINSESSICSIPCDVIYRLSFYSVDCNKEWTIVLSLKSKRTSARAEELSVSGLNIFGRGIWVCYENWSNWCGGCDCLEIVNWDHIWICSLPYQQSISVRGCSVRPRQCLHVEN